MKELPRTTFLPDIVIILVSDCSAARNNAIQKKVENRNKTMTSLDVIKLFETGDNRQ